MKQLVFIKTSPSIQLAHLYEHIICMQLVLFLQEKGLYQYIDYDLVGKTYHGGIVYIEISLHTKIRINIGHYLNHLKLTFSEQVISTGLKQLTLEKRSQFGAKDFHTIQVALAELHQQKWQSIDAFDLLDVNSIRRNSKVLYMSNTKPPRFYVLKISIRHKEGLPIDNELLPLARQVYKAIAVNLSATLANTYGYFSVEDSFKNSKTSFELRSQLLIGELIPGLEKKYIKTTHALVVELIKRGAIKRFSKQLRSISYAKRPLNAPNVESAYEDTLIFVGSKGWKRIATDEAIEQLLRDSTIEFKVQNYRSLGTLL